MTFSDFISDHGTKLLGSVTAMVGTAQVGISSLVTGNVITAGDGILCQFILGVLAAGLGGVTIARGFSTGAIVQQAKQIVATNAAQYPPPGPPAGAKS
jgi:hypothetical protein